MYSDEHQVYYNKKFIVSKDNFDLSKLFPEATPENTVALVAEGIVYVNDIDDAQHAEDFEAIIGTDAQQLMRQFPPEELSPNVRYAAELYVEYVEWCSRHGIPDLDSVLAWVDQHGDRHYHLISK